MSWIDLQKELGLTLRPLQSKAWLQVGGARSVSPFSAPLKDTLKLLKTELRAINARRIVCEIDIREGDLRLDGLPRASAIAETPAIALSFESKHGALRLTFDGFWKWEHNLLALAMHLNHLRMASLYGVGSAGEQYRGWVAIEARSEDSETQKAAQVIARCSSHGRVGIHDDEACFNAAYRVAVSRTHPDRGGKVEEFREVQAAGEVLKRRFGG